MTGEERDDDSLATCQASSGGVGDPCRNAPDTFTEEQRGQLEGARLASFELKKTFEHWIAIARALKILREKANIARGRKLQSYTFQRLQDEQGLGIIDDSTVSRLKTILEHEVDVMRWREGLSPERRFAWASPSSVCSQCPALKKKASEPPADKPRKDKPSLRSQLDRSKAENERLHALVEELEAARPSSPPDQIDVANFWNQGAQEIADTIRDEVDAADYRATIKVRQQRQSG
jgi:hypothetical protein